jgi:integrase
VLDYHLIANFGELRIESIRSSRIEGWRDEQVSEHGMSRRNANKLLAILHGVFEHAVRKHGLLVNPVKDVEKLCESYDAACFDFYSPEEVRELVARASDAQDGALYLTAAFSGLRRGELIGLLWEDVDFENHSLRVWETVTRRERGRPKSRKSRTVPMVDDVASVLKALKGRERHTEPKDTVVANEDGGAIDGSALRRRYIEDLDCASCASMTCAIPLGRWRSTPSRSCRFRRGWGTRILRRRCATCTTRAAPTTHASSRAPSAPRRRI